MNKTVELKARYYRAIPIDRPGYEDITFELSLEKTALVGMHCWNIGCPDGPAVDMKFCVGMGWPEATKEAGRIMVDVIRPAMDAARKVGMAVCHVESDWMDQYYPEMASRKKPYVESGGGIAKEMRERAHGVGYMTQSPLTKMKRAAVVSAQGNEPMFFYSDVFDAYLKERGIDTLIYMGFATDMCVLGAEGGARPMLSRGYRCILMRDATVGVETPQTFPERLATRYGTHLFEWQIGYGTCLDDYVAALNN